MTKTLLILRVTDTLKHKSSIELFNEDKRCLLEQLINSLGLFSITVEKIGEVYIDCLEEINLDIK